MAENTSIWPGWETVKLIGRGSFGMVYEIERKLFDDVEKAALKVISIPQNESDIEEMYNDGYDSESITSTFNSHLKNIVAEYSLMKKMSGCRNIVMCDDVRYVQHDDGIGWDIYIKMELLTPLVKSLPERPSEDLVLNLAKDLCNALVYCKKYDIVHRDIKPQNIFVSENGEYKLGDFGIAKIVEKTMGGTKIGTYKYMAPEVYNNQPYGSAADIYSLGLVLYWLLNERRMPFMPLPPAKLKSGMEEEARNRRLSGETIPAPKNGSKALKEIVLKACAYDVGNRYSSAAEMLADLEKIECGAVTQPPEVVNESFLCSIAQNDEIEEDGTVSLFTRESEPKKSELKQEEKIEAPVSVVESVTETAKQKETPAVKETVTPVKQSEEKEETPVKKNGGKKGLIIGAIILIAAIIVFLLIRGCGDTEPGGSGDKSTETVSEIVSDTSTEESFVPSVSDEDEHTHSYSSNWKYNEAAHWNECTCGAESVFYDHSFGYWETVTAPTCSTPGEKTRICSDCGYKELQAMNMVHHYEEGICIYCEILQSEGLDIRIETAWNGEPGLVLYGVGSCIDTEIHIPAKFMGLYGVRIAENAFENCNSITNVKIYGLVNVCKRAFAGCENLKTVEFAYAPACIGESAFLGCGELSFVSIPDANHGLEICDFAFAGCENLKSISLPRNTHSIGGAAFQGCGFTEITIPETVAVIKWNAFADTPLSSAYFEDINGWYVSLYENATSGIYVDVGDPEDAASYLKEGYNTYCWHND